MKRLLELEREEREKLFNKRMTARDTARWETVNAQHTKHTEKLYKQLVREGEVVFIYYRNDECGNQYAYFSIEKISDNKSPQGQGG